MKPASRGHAKLKPGKDYYFNVYAYRLFNWQLHITPPTGYRVFIEDVERRRLNCDGGYAEGRLVKVRIENGAAMGVGEATDLRPGRVVWSVGLGTLTNGRPAGVISLRENNLAASTFKPAALAFDTDSTDVWILRREDNITLHQIKTPQALVDIWAVTDKKFYIRFYRPDGPMNFDNGQWWPQESPYLQYDIENPDDPPGTYFDTDPESGEWREFYHSESTARLRITKTLDLNGTTSWFTELTRFDSSHSRVTDWTRTGTTAASMTDWYYSNSGRNEVIEVKSSTGTLASRTQKVYADYAWGRELVQTVQGEGLSNPVVTNYDYVTNPAFQGAYKQLSSSHQPGGNFYHTFICNDLDRSGNMAGILRQYKDQYEFRPQNYDWWQGNNDFYDYNFADWTGRYTLPTSIGTWTEGTQTVGANISYTYESKNGDQVLVASRWDHSGLGQSIQTITKTYREDADYPRRRLPGKPHSIKRADGTMQAFVYVNGSYNPANRTINYGSGEGGFVEIAINGTSVYGSGDNFPAGLFGDQYRELDAEFHVVPNRSTRSIVVHAADGTVPYVASEIYVGGGSWVRVSGTATTYANSKFPLVVTRDSGSSTSWVVSENIWANGLLDMTIDAQGIQRKFHYDDAGRVVKTQVLSVAGQPQNGEQWTAVNYDAAGRVTESRLQTSSAAAAADIVTQTEYDLAGRVTKTRAPGQSGFMETTYAYHVDGNPMKASVTGPSGATVTTETFRDGRTKSITGNAVTSQTFTYDLLGDGRRSVNVQHGTGAVYTTWTDWLGRTISQDAPSAVDGHFLTVNYSYDAAGRLHRTQQGSMSGAGFTPSVADTYQDYDVMGAPFRQWVDLNENGVLDLSGYDRVTETESYWESAGGYWWASTWNYVYHQPGSSSRTFMGGTRTRLTGLDGFAQSDVRAFDASSNESRSLTLVTRSERKIVQQTFVAGASTASESTNINGFVASTRDAAGATATFAYDGYGRPTYTYGRDSVRTQTDYHSGTALPHHVKWGPSNVLQQTFNYDGAGRLSHQIAHDGDRSLHTRYQYNDRSQVTHQWGNGAAPLKYTYDSFGRQTGLTTYRTGDFTSSGLPGDFSNPGDTTTWAYDSETGLVTSKTDAKGKTVSFAYDAANRLVERKWARIVDNQRLTTTYAYYTEAGYRTGELSSVSYSDETPAVDYLYTVDGNPMSSTSTTRFGQLRAVVDGFRTHSYGYDGPGRQYSSEGDYTNNIAIHLSFTTSGPVIGRPKGHTLYSVPSYATIHTTDHAFESSTGRLASIQFSNGSVNRTWNYAYKANSNLLHTVTSGAFQRTITWNSERDVIDQTATSWSGLGDRARFGYGHDPLGRRTGQRSEAAFTSLFGIPEGIQQSFSYADRGDLATTSATRVGGASLPEHYRDWQYDPIGNRISEAASAGSSTYTTNAANQYTSVTGANADACAYDDDGNLIEDGTNYYKYDAENRLIRVTRKSDGQKFLFRYDYLGRRVEKAEETASGAPVSKRRYVYQGHQIIAELDGNNLATVLRQHAWGLDLSGSIGGGGGVGGLLFTQDNENGVNSLPLYDANGNVRGLLNESGTIIASYDFGAFGEILRSAGSYAAHARFLFASKAWDGEVGLYQYNYRYYSPKHGRFINRDPIEEAGGVNLYAYCRNNPVSGWDLLGCDPQADAHDVASSAGPYGSAAYREAYNRFWAEWYESLGVDPNDNYFDNVNGPFDASFDQFQADGEQARAARRSANLAFVNSLFSATLRQATAASANLINNQITAIYDGATAAAANLLHANSRAYVAVGDLDFKDYAFRRKDGSYTNEGDGGDYLAGLVHVGAQTLDLLFFAVTTEDPKFSQAWLAKAQSMGVDVTSGYFEFAGVMTTAQSFGVLGLVRNAPRTLVAAETKMVTLYRGTTYYDALEAVGNNAVNMERVVQRQLSAGYPAERQGLYLTTQESTAQFYADLAGLQGRGGGPAVLRFEVPEAQFQQFLQRNSIKFEAPVPRPPFPGQTETLIPTSAVDEFNSLSTIFQR